MLLVWSLAVVGAEWVERHGSGVMLDNLYTDTWHQWSGVRHTPAHVALVAVDQASLRAYPDDPLVFWGPYFARAIKTLDAVGAKVIGLDFLYAISPDAWLNKMALEGSMLSRVYDAPFREVINSGKVVLVGSRMRDDRTDRDHYLLPHADYVLSLPDLDLAGNVGLSDLTTDGDGVVRHFELRPKARPADAYEVGSVPVLTLPALLAAKARDGGVDSLAIVSDSGMETALDAKRSPIFYLGPPGAFPRISLARLTAPGALQDPAIQALRGKVVLIGADYAGMGDVHFTPYSSGLGGRAAGLMAGVELQANIAEALLSGKVWQRPAPVLRWMLLVVFGGLAVLLFMRLNAWRGVLVLPALLFLPVWLSWLAFGQTWLISAAGPQVAVLFGFVGVLTSRLSREGRERARVSSLFSRYVSDSVVKQLLKEETMPDMGGELYQVTVLFSDIRNFTTISELLTPNEVVEMLNVYFDRVCNVVLEEGGSIDKFIGDAIMVEFGAPVRSTDHAYRALRTAVRMRGIAEDFRSWMVNRFAGRGLPDFGVGIGLHTGPAIVGTVGSSKRSEFTAIGDTVNVASRLEGVTKEMQCVIVASQETVAAVHCVETGQARSVKVKGHVEPIQVVEILGMPDLQAANSQAQNPQEAL